METFHLEKESGSPYFLFQSFLMECDDYRWCWTDDMPDPELSLYKENKRIARIIVRNNMYKNIHEAVEKRMYEIKKYQASAVWGGVHVSFSETVPTQEEKEMRAKTFYFVDSPIRIGTSKTYYTEKEATIESKRLAQKHQGEKFYVLKTIACYAVQPNEVSEVEFEEDE